MIQCTDSRYGNTAVPAQEAFSLRRSWSSRRPYIQAPADARRLWSIPSDGVLTVRLRSFSFIPPNLSTHPSALWHKGAHQVFLIIKIVVYLAWCEKVHGRFWLAETAELEEVEKKKKNGKDASQGRQLFTSADRSRLRYCFLFLLATQAANQLL